MKKYLVTGLIILLPVALTVMIVFFLFDLFTAPFVPVITGILHALSVSLSPHVTLFLSRVIALVLLCVLITFLGMVAQHILFEYMARVGNWIFYRIPFVKSIYKVTKDIFTALFSPDGKQAFKESIMFLFPNEKIYGIGFLSGEIAKECQEKIPETLVNVFFPTAPHPLSGFLFMVPKEDTYPVAMTKEDTLKFLVSCGIIHPEAEKIHEIE